MIIILIIFYTVVAICFFFFWVDKTKLREYYSSLLTISYLRFLEQYILIYVLKVWKYKHLPTLLGKVIDVPILLDVTLYPMVGYLFIHYLHTKSVNLMTYYLLWSLTLWGVEYTLVLSGMLEQHKYWNFIFSYFLALTTLIMIHLQYKLFLRTGWYQTEG